MTETGFYILLCLREPNHGYGIVQKVKEITGGDIVLTPGTMYGSLSKMEKDGLICFQGEEDKRKKYLITKLGSLSSMHKMGWKFTKVIFHGLYYFEECEPENVTYRLDYNQEGIRNKAEYVQMFSDCGWEYLFDFAGYSYFRKGSDESDTDDEIFCDDESRLDMMKRVYRGRIIPLIVLFCCTIFPQFLINSHNNGSVVQDILSVLLLVMGMLYLCIFFGFSIQFYKFEKKIHTEDEKLKWKYVGIFSALFLCAFVFVSVAYLKMSSKYTINDRDNGFAIEAERLNRKVVKEYELLSL